MSLRRRLAWPLVVAVLTSAVVAYGDTIHVKNTFSAGEPIRASDVNANFDEIQRVCDGHDAELSSHEGRITTCESRLSTDESRCGDLSKLQTNSKTDLVSAINEVKAGAQGAQGPQGPQGPSGSQGIAGPQGAQGPAGPQGPQGAQGIPGTPGSQGPAGLSLNWRGDFDQTKNYAKNDLVCYGGSSYIASATVQGSSGTPDVTTGWAVLAQAGATGTAGPQGSSGAMGPAGPQGLVGPTGPQGPQGTQGPQGPQGNQGPAGVQGAAGPQGPQGIAGAQGPQGAAGLSFNWRSTFDPAQTYSKNDIVAFGGCSYVATTSVSGASGTPDATSGWDLVAAQGTTGPQGPQGPAGAAGATGSTGATGAIGPQGPQGVAGPQGPAGPQGAAGPQGPQGAQGPMGATGAQGPAGQAGPQGIPGSPGFQGPAGPMGPQGPQGPAGTGVIFLVSTVNQNPGGNYSTWTDGTVLGGNTAVGVVSLPASLVCGKPYSMTFRLQTADPTNPGENAGQPLAGGALDLDLVWTYVGGTLRVPVTQTSVATLTITAGQANDVSTTLTGAVPAAPKTPGGLQTTLLLDIKLLVHGATTTAQGQSISGLEVYITP